MLRINKNLILAAAVGVAIAAPGAAFATNGYFAHGYGTKTKGMAGAGVAYSQDAMAAATNPAGMVHVGGRMDVGAAIFNPNREYTTDTAGLAAPGQESDTNFFLIPHLGYNRELSSDQSVGITVYGNGGMNTDYNDSVFFGAGGSTGVDLAQLFIVPSYAQKITPKISVGAGLVLAYQEFRAKGLDAFGGISSDSNNLTDNGVDNSTGIGIKIGGQLDVGNGITVGLAYTPKIDMSEFDDYAGLFAEQGDFDIPSTLVVGAAWEMSPKVTLALDYQTINYEDVAAVSNDGPPATGALATPATFLGTDDGLGFGWENINIIKIAVAYKHSDDWTFRAGLNHGDNPIGKEDVLFNILAPGVMEDHLTFGFTKKMSSKSELNFALMHALEESVEGVTPAGAGGGTTEIKMNQNEVELSYGMKF